MDDVRDCGLNRLIIYPPYSPDLTPSDYLMFPNMKNTWIGSSIGPMMRSYLHAVKDFFEDQVRTSISRESKR